MFARKLLCCISIACALLSGCGGDKPAATPAGDARTSPSSESRTLPKEFDLLEVRAAAYRGDAALLFTFSRPLASAQDFKQLIGIQDAEGKPLDDRFVLDEDPRKLYFPYVKAGESYAVTVDVLVASADGATLPRAHSASITAVAAPPVVGFASQGDVLPVKNAGGLPLISMNVDAVDVEFLRVNPADMSRVALGLVRKGRGGSYELEQITEFAESVYSGRFAVRPAPNARQVSHLPILDIKALQEPGIYIALLKRAGDFSYEAYDTTWFTVSDIGVHTRSYRDQTLIVARSLSTGKALCAVRYKLVDRYAALINQGETDCDGIAKLPAAPGKDQVLVIEQGGQLNVLAFNEPALDLSEFPVDGLPADRVGLFTWSGRDLYRPGETLRFHALLRGSDGEAITNGPLFAQLKKPDGSVYASQLINGDDAGYYDYERVMPGDVPTGRWTFALSTDPSAQSVLHEFRFRVEEFLPERLKLDLQTAEERLSPGDPLQVAVEANYLYGAPAAGNRLGTKLNILPKHALMPSLKGYFFGDATDKPKFDMVEADSMLDDQGKTTLNLALEVSPVTQPLAASLITSVFETGGRAVTRVIERVIWPADVLVGVRPLFEGEQSDANQRVGFEVVRVNPQGQQQAGALRATLIREVRDYRWEFVNNRWRSDYTERMVEVESQDLSATTATATRLTMPVEWGGYRLEITDPATQLITRYRFTAGYNYDDDNRGSAPRPDKVKLGLDKTRYAVGDTVKVTIIPPHPGAGVLLVETDTLLQKIPFDAAAQTVLDVKLDPSWNRHDLYMTALVFRPGSSSEKVTPSRAVGLVHIPLDRSDRAVQTTLSAPAQMEPGRALEVNVAAPDLAGKKAYVAISAVDMGVINITAFALPDPLALFFGKRRYAIDAHDMYGRLIEVLAGDALTLRSGGDLALAALAGVRRPPSDQAIVDLYSGPVALDAQGRALVKMDVPNFNGELRVSAVVYSADRFGNAQSNVIVKAPVVVEASMPRALSPGDRSTVTVDVQNFMADTRTFTLTARSSAPLRLSGEHALTLAPNQKQSVVFDLGAELDAGVGALEFTLMGGTAPITRSYQIPVRPAYPAIRESLSRTIEDSGPIALQSSFSNLLPATVRSRVSLARELPLPLAAVVGDLLVYPHGCIEQTTSSTWPWVMVDPALSTKLGLRLPDLDRSAQVDLGLNRIAGMQLETGHFAYWPGDADYSDPALTPYVVEMLLDAKDAGFAIPAGVLEKSTDRLREDLLAGGVVSYARHWGERAEHARFAYSSYAGYLLARLGNAPLGTLRNLFDNDRDDARTGLSVLHLGLALRAAGDARRATEAITEALGTRYQRNDEWLGDYGSNLSDHATILALLLSADALPSTAQSKLIDVSRSLRSREYLSTTEQLAILRLGRALGLKPRGSLTGTLKVGELSESFKTSGLFVRDLSAPDLAAGASLIAEGARPLYLIQDTVGVPRTAPSSVSAGVSIVRRYYRPNGRLLGDEPLYEGDTLVVKLTINASTDFNDGVITDLLPAGLESENPNLLNAGALEGLKVGGESLSDLRSNMSLRYEEFRDDRYVAALELSRGGSQNLYYTVRAVSPGVYRVPPPTTEEMYNPAIRAIGEAVPTEIEVRSR